MTSTFAATVAVRSNWLAPTPQDFSPQDSSRQDPVASKEILRIADAIKRVCGVTEDRFLEIGRRLGSSVEILERLKALFSKLQVELDSPEMRGATEGLAQVAAQISVLAGTQRDERAALEKLSRIAAGLGARIDKIHNEVRTIEVLTINARITASSIGAASADFLTYFGEIGKALKVTEINLRHFRDDLMEVNKHLRAASASEADFDTRQAATITVIPRRLSESIRLITARRQAAATAAGQVSDRSRHVGDGIARVISALQIGDATRQRMEHVQEVAQLLAQILTADDAAASAADEPWTALSDRERQGLAADGCALQTAQLLDTAEEFGREITSVHTVIAELSADAREIVRLSNATFESAGQNGAFLSELEADVSQTHALFEGFYASRVSADQTMGSVLEIVTRLAQHIRTVRRVEADISIMGVNATVMSGRMGTVGAALRVVADEVTKSSGRTAAESKAATADVENTVSTAQSLVGEEQSARLAQITAVIELMTTSTTRLRGVADGLASALDALRRDGLAVARHLDDTAASLSVADDIDSTLRLAAEDFTSVASTLPASDSSAAAASARMFQLISARYTMARERDILARIAHGSAASAAATAPAAQTSIDDMLF
jgi:hypothetical protein